MTALHKKEGLLSKAGCNPGFPTPSLFITTFLHVLLILSFLFPLVLPASLFFMPSAPPRESFFSFLPRKTPPAAGGVTAMGMEGEYQWAGRAK